MSELVKFALQHPLAVLVFALIVVALWLIACFISVMPPLPDGASWGVRWVYACAQIFGASLDKAARIAAQTTIVKNAEKFVMNADGSTLKEAVQVSQTGPTQPIPQAPSQEPSSMKSNVVSVFLLGASLLALPALTGCKPAGVSGQPTAPTQGYQQAAQAMSNFATDLQQVQQAEINLHHGGVIDKPTHATIETAIQQIALYGKQGDALISAQASATTIRTKINAALDSANAITLQTGKLDPSTAAQLTNAITAIKLLLGSVLDALPNPVSEVKTYGPSDNRHIGRAAYTAGFADLQTGGVSSYSRRYVAAIG